MTLPRGIRNNNPGNLRITQDQWKGLAPDQTDPDFFRFSAPRWGIRAMARVLQVYQDVKQLRTVREIIHEWSPTHENPTDSYITAVQIWSGLDADEPIDVTDYATALALVRAMVRFENGKPPDDRPADWYASEVYEAGLRLSGISPQKPLSKSRTTKGAATAVGAIGAAAGILSDTFGLPPEIAGLLPTALASASEETVSTVVLLIGLAGAAYAIYARADDQRKGRL